MFKNAANVALSGNTFDAKHLDKFIGGQYGEKQFQPGNDDQTKRSVGLRSVLPHSGGGGSFISSLSQHMNSRIRPSFSFVSMPRSEYKQHIYIDENDGPSPLQLQSDPLKDKNQQSKIYYEQERENHLNAKDQSISKLNTAKRLLYSKNVTHNDDKESTLVKPSVRREEVNKIRNYLDTYYSYKKNHVDLSQRERSIKHGWRHGVTGLENAESVHTSIYYKDQSDQFNDNLRRANNRKDQRQESKFTFSVYSDL